jgi:hypothetical protein
LLTTTSEEVTRRDIYVSGSVTMVRAMLANGLIEELHLFVYPLTRSKTTAVGGVRT